MPPKRRAATPARRPAAPPPANNNNKGPPPVPLPPPPVARNYQRELHQFLARYQARGDVNAQFKTVYAHLLANRLDAELDTIEEILKGMGKVAKSTNDGWQIAEIPNERIETAKTAAKVGGALVAAGTGIAAGYNTGTALMSMVMDHVKDNPGISTTALVATLGIVAHQFFQHQTNVANFRAELQARNAQQAPPGQLQIQAPPPPAPQAQPQKAPPPQPAQKAPPPQPAQQAQSFRRPTSAERMRGIRRLANLPESDTDDF